MSSLAASPIPAISEQPEPSPESTLAIILGASDWPHHKSLGGSASAFRNSANGINDFFLSSNGMALPADNVLNLFDDSSAVSDLDASISQFLQDRIGQLKSRSSIVRDLVLIYIGHGGFIHSEDAYFLAIRSTREDGEGTSGFRISSLASTLKRHAGHIRRYLIIDACFAASAYAAFQSSPLEVARKNTEHELPPDRGTALLCSSSALSPSSVPIGNQYTMFSGELLQILNTGIPNKPNRLSLSDVGEAVKLSIKDKYRDYAIRPEVHAPDQRTGNVANVPLFLNIANRDRNSNRNEQSAQKKTTTISNHIQIVLATSGVALIVLCALYFFGTQYITMRRSPNQSETRNTIADKKKNEPAFDETSVQIKQPNNIQIESDAEKKIAQVSESKNTTATPLKKIKKPMMKQRIQESQNASANQEAKQIPVSVNVMTDEGRNVRIIHMATQSVMTKESKSVVDDQRNDQWKGVPVARFNIIVEPGRYMAEKEIDGIYTDCPRTGAHPFTIDEKSNSTVIIVQCR